MVLTFSPARYHIYRTLELGGCYSLCILCNEFAAAVISVNKEHANRI